MIDADHPLPSSQPVAPAWSVEGFARFWARPDVRMVPPVLTADVEGHWPRLATPVRGVDLYARSIAELLSILPDFRGEVAEHATAGNAVFVRWVARATVPVGDGTITGIDRVLLRDGRVMENRICSDHPVFELLAQRLRPLVRA